LFSFKDRLLFQLRTPGQDVFTAAMVHIIWRYIPDSRTMGFVILEALDAQLPKFAFPAIVRASGHIVPGQGIGDTPL
jgi:hypothetical protein